MRSRRRCFGMVRRWFALGWNTSVLTIEEMKLENTLGRTFFRSEEVESEDAEKYDNTID
jgi:hypothetical protein